MRVAVYGGSFDPPHLGHVMVVSHLLLNDPTVDQVLIVPCFQQTGKSLQKFEHRYSMCNDAFGWLPRTVISTVEKVLGGESITLRTMQYLKKTNPNWDLRFVMGMDLMESCRSWDGWEELEEIAPPMPIGRAGISPIREGDPTPIAPLVSSSIVRKALAEGNYTAAERYLPKNVLNFIHTNQLYLKCDDEELLDPYERRVATEADRKARSANDELQQRKIFCYYCQGRCIPTYLADRCVVQPDGDIRPACRFHADEGRNVRLMEGLQLLLAKGIQET